MTKKICAVCWGIVRIREGIFYGNYQYGKHLIHRWCKQVGEIQWGVFVGRENSHKNKEKFRPAEKQAEIDKREFRRKSKLMT